MNHERTNICVYIYINGKNVVIFDMYLNNTFPRTELYELVEVSSGTEAVREFALLTDIITNPRRLFPLTHP